MNSSPAPKKYRICQSLSNVLQNWCKIKLLKKIRSLSEFYKRFTCQTCENAAALHEDRPNSEKLNNENPVDRKIAACPVQRLHWAKS